MSSGLQKYEFHCFEKREALTDNNNRKDQVNSPEDESTQDNFQT